MELVFINALSHRPRLNIRPTLFLKPSQKAINEMKNQFLNQTSSSTKETDEPSRKRAKESEDIIEFKNEKYESFNEWEKHLQEQEDYQLYRYVSLKERRKIE